MCEHFFLLAFVCVDALKTGAILMVRRRWLSSGMNQPFLEDGTVILDACSDLVEEEIRETRMTELCSES